MDETQNLFTPKSIKTKKGIFRTQARNLTNATGEGTCLFQARACRRVGAALHPPWPQGTIHVCCCPVLCWISQCLATSSLLMVMNASHG